MAVIIWRGAGSSYLTGLNHAEQKLNVVKDVLKDLLLADPEVRVVIIGMRADVDDAVHVEIQIVKLRNLIFLDDFTETWIPLRQPAVKLWNSHLGLSFLRTSTSCLL